MPDNRKLRAPHDGKLISVRQRWERSYWCTRFRCTETELALAVMLAGPSDRKVRAALNAARAKVRSRSRRTR